MTIKEQRDLLYRTIEDLEQKVQSFKTRLDESGIDSFRTKEAVLNLNSARNSLSYQESGPEHITWEFSPHDLEGEFPF